jgi:uncharacterized protein (UPF0332 family)
LQWCAKRKLGLRFQKPDVLLAKQYLKNAEETLAVLEVTTSLGSKMWMAAQQYYALYFMAYAFLMRFGVKSEIHACTIAFIGLLEEEGIAPQGLHSRLMEAKDLRIDNQYYLKNLPVDADIRSLGRLVLEVRITVERMDESTVSRIRDAFRQA